LLNVTIIAVQKPKTNMVINIIVYSSQLLCSTASALTLSVIN